MDTCGKCGKEKEYLWKACWHLPLYSSGSKVFRNKENAIRLIATKRADGIPAWLEREEIDG